MTTTSKKLKTLSASCLSSALLLVPTLSSAAPGTLSDVPMFLTNPVEPNILFMIDDSGSMDWGLMTSESSGIVNLGCAYYYAQPAVDNDYVWIVPTESALIDQGIAAPYGGVWRSWNSRYNRIYYDHSVTYVPWAGENNGGVVYGNANPVAAPVNPYDSTGTTVNLTATTTYNTDYCAGGLGSFTVNNFHPARYYEWTDSDGDNIVDPDDDHALIEIKPSVFLYPGGPNRWDCASPAGCTYAEEIQNFANWYSYYRKREYVAKAAYGQIIAGASNSRMGLVTIHNNGSVNSGLTAMNADPTTGAKGSLLESLYQFQSSGGTPLRSALDNGGKYLGCESNDFFGTCPALPTNQGGECQQNFSVLMTDGYYNGTFSGIGNTDGDNNTTWDSDTDGPFGDDSEDTLADVAMEYYESDIRPGTANLLSPPPGSIDENTAQHMVTFGVAFGVEGNLSDMPANDSDPFAWPAPLTDAARIDDLRHAAWNSRGEFHSAQNSAQLISGLRSALRSIQSRVGSSASVAFNSGSLSTNSEIYLALFDSEQWHGDILAFKLDPTNGDIEPTPKWSAASKLTQRNLASNDRTILTFDGDDGIPFKWSALTIPQRADLLTNPSGATDTVPAGMARLAHIRGDRSCEPSSNDACSHSDGSLPFTAKSLRERHSRLADIVHSTPVFVGSPESNWPDTKPFPGGIDTAYSEYREAKADRTGVVYVGANDGMLHGFRQSDGEEVLAYIPGSLFSSGASEGLHYFTDPSYTHRYGVDLRASISDVFAKTRPTGSESWKTILVGGLRGGGRGIFALDVTDPDSFSQSTTKPADTVMWEFSVSDDPDLGHTFSQPAIVPLADSGSDMRWAAVFGNGYNDLGSGEAKLFILFIEEGLDGTWTPDSDYIEISTGTGTTTDRNGLSTPAIVDTDGDGLADRAYAGDLQGNMWAFDLTGSNAGNWDVAYKQGQTPQALFSAPANQQITTGPVVVRNNATPTSSQNSPNTLVIFGTGQYLTSGDITSTNQQSMYGIWDAGDAEIEQSDLLQQTVSLGATSSGDFGRTLTDYDVDYGSDFGWYMDLPESGERSITDAVIRGDLVFFNTMIPDTNPCAAGGRGWLMVAKWSNGGRPPEVAFDLNNNGLLDAEDKINDEAPVGVEIVGIPTAPVILANKRYTSTTQTTGGSTVEVTEIINTGGPKTGRLSWEELTP